MKNLTQAIWSVVLGILATLLVGGLDSLKFFRTVEYASLDARFQTRNGITSLVRQTQTWLKKPVDVASPTESMAAQDAQQRSWATSADPRVVLVGIDDPSLRTLGAYPLPRRYHGQMLALLESQKPGVVAWDILFTEPKLDSPEDDLALVEGAARLPRVIFGAATEAVNDPNDPRFRRDLAKIGPTRPLPLVSGDPSRVPQVEAAQLPFETDHASLLQNSLVGFVNAAPDIDGKVRFLPMVVRWQGSLFPSLVLQSVIQWAKAKPEEVKIDLGNEIVVPTSGAPLRIPIDQAGRLLINYRHHLENFRNINYLGLGQLLDKLNSNPSMQRPEALPPIEDAIVLFGLTGTGFDKSPLPLGGDWAPQVAVHLNALDNILRQDFLREIPATVFLPLFFVIAFLTAWLLFGVSYKLMVRYAIAVLGAYALASFGLFEIAQIWLPTATPLVALACVYAAVESIRYAGGEKEKEKIKQVMASYISRKVMDEVLANPEKLKLGGENREISVLFCDIRGFTKYCQNRDPQEVVAVLNEYLGVMTDVIFKYDGTLDKYIGDCIMAFWNAPKEQLDHAQRAVCCAIEMRYALAAYKTKRAGVDTEIFECGIGVHTGQALVGNIGTDQQRDYTAIGATVNLAARLEALTKRFTARILISDATQSQISGDFTITDLGEVPVQGFDNRVRIYSVEPYQDIMSALKVGRAIASQADYTAEEVIEPLHQPAALPDDADISDAAEDPEEWRKRQARPPE